MLGEVTLGAQPRARLQLPGGDPRGDVPGHAHVSQVSVTPSGRLKIACI
jgi:hypothetical protein